MKLGKQKTISDYYEDRNNIPISEIIIGKRERSQYDEGEIKKLAGSIQEIGLMNPIIITREKKLVSGFHRILAFKELGLNEIPYTITTIEDPLKLELQEIDENLIRGDLVCLEEGEHLIKRKELYEKIHPETKQGISQALGMNKKLGYNVGENISSTSNKSFTQEISEKLSVSQRTVQMKIARNIIQELRDAVRDTKIANRNIDLDALSRKEPDYQKELAEQVYRMKKETIEINRLNDVVLQLELFKKSSKSQRDQEIIQVKDRQINNAIIYLRDKIYRLDSEAYQYVTVNGIINWEKYKELQNTTLWREGKDLRFILNDLEGIKQVEWKDSALHHENPYPWEHLFSQGLIYDKQNHNKGGNLLKIENKNNNKKRDDGK